MTDTTPRTISLNEIGLKYIATLQRLSDIMVFSWAGASTASESVYHDLERSIPGLPSTEFRLSFAAAKEASEQWWLKQSLNEGLGICLIFIEDVRKLCALVAFQVARANASGNLGSLAAELNAAPGPPDFLTRFKQLEDRYLIRTPLQDEILSLAALARCLFQYNGVVPEGSSLQLRLKMMQPPAPGESKGNLGDFQRSWAAGETVSLPRDPHAAIFTTLSVFIGALLSSVQEYAQRSGLPAEPAPQ